MKQRRFIQFNIGLRDWLIQRITAAIMALYALVMLSLALLSRPINYTTWQQWFYTPWVHLTTLLTLAAIFAHAYIGVWTIITDYIPRPWQPLFIWLLRALLVSEWLWVGFILM